MLYVLINGWSAAVASCVASAGVAPSQDLKSRLSKRKAGTAAAVVHTEWFLPFTQKCKNVSKSHRGDAPIT